MNIAIIKDGECVNAAIFDDIATAQEFLSLGVWPEADSVAELPEGFGIGDGHADGEWTKAEQPEPEPAPEPAHDPLGSLAALVVELAANQAILELEVKS